MQTELVDTKSCAPAACGTAEIKTMTLAGLIQQLEPFTNHALSFRLGDDDIGSGYHVTELKQASIKSIDCGGRTDAWDETVLQLLDGSGGTHMPVAKFVAIARKSDETLPGLATAPMFVEYAPDNQGLRRLKITGLAQHDDRAVIVLEEDRAACKPFVDWQNAMAASDCCANPAQQSKCC